MSKLKETVLKADEIKSQQPNQFSEEAIREAIAPIVQQYGAEDAQSLLRAGVGFIEAISRADIAKRESEALEVRKRFITDYVAPRIYQPSTLDQKVTCVHIVSAGNENHTDHMYISATDNEIRVAECKSNDKLSAEKMGVVFGAFKNLVRETKAHSGRAIVVREKVEQRKLELGQSGESK